MGSPANAGIDPRGGDPYAATFDGMDIPRLAEQDVLMVVKDLEELIDLAARVLENAVGPDDIERTLDGFSRLCDMRPPDFARLTAPLMKRVEQLLKRGCVPFAGEGPASDFCGLIHAWLTGQTATLELTSNQHGNELGDWR